MSRNCAQDIASCELTLIREIGPLLAMMPLRFSVGNLAKGGPMKLVLETAWCKIEYWSRFRGYDHPLVIKLQLVPTWNNAVSWATEYGQSCPLGPAGFGWRVGLVQDTDPAEHIQPVGLNGTVRWVLDPADPTQRFHHFKLLPAEGDMGTYKLALS